MSKEWLNAESFERFLLLISAVNSILIHNKLKTAGVEDISRNAEFNSSRKHLLEFLDKFSPVVQEMERDDTRVSVGTDPRLGDLARGLADMRRQRPRKSSLASISLTELRDLVSRDDADNRERLVAYLRDLRRFLEQQAHSDVVSILGEL